MLMANKQINPNVANINTSLVLVYVDAQNHPPPPPPPPLSQLYNTTNTISIKQCVAKNSELQHFLCK